MARSRDPFDEAVKKVKTGKYWRQADAVAVLEELERSGLTVVEFIRKHNLPEKRVRQWKTRLKDVFPQKAERKAEQPQFVALQVVETEEREPAVAQRPWAPAGQVASLLEVVVYNGRVVRVPVGFDPMTLSQVVEVLEVTPC